jgi:Ca2+-binding EF-hand superfamily protein
LATIQPSSNNIPNLNPSDFKTLATSHDERQINMIVDKVFAQVDSDGNGTWSFDEVKEMCN